MKLSQAGELSLLDSLRNRFQKKAGGLILGIGDDAAVIRSAGNTLLTTDMMVEGVHFDLAWTTPFQLGYKLISVNMSDIYAMGGTPRYVLLNFSAPKNCTTGFFDKFFDGIKAALDEHGAALIGGDISASDRMMLSATAIGTARKVIRRKGANIGDRIYISGTVGDSACGLELLRKIAHPVDLKIKRQKSLPLAWDVIRPLLERHLMPAARNSALFAKKATAMIDLSDGLLIDLSRLCKESSVGARLNQADIPISEELTKAAAYLEADPLTFALAGGEDYELLFTAPSNAKIKARSIGEITRGSISLIGKDGRKMEITAKGYEHFSFQG